LSKDHLRPQTYCLCPSNFATQLLFYLISRLSIDLSLEPDDKILSLQDNVPTLL